MGQNSWSKSRPSVSALGTNSHVHFFSLMVFALVCNGNGESISWFKRVGSFSSLSYNHVDEPRPLSFAVPSTFELPPLILRLSINGN